MRKSPEKAYALGCQTLFILAPLKYLVTWSFSGMNAHKFP